MIVEALGLLVEGRSLRREQAAAAMEELMSGQASPAQAAAFLVALRMKGETVEEIAGMASVMREKAAPVRVTGAVIDTCGTGGDGHGTLNISTAAAFVAAGAGLKVAKHGNRGMTSKSGSADVLEALGYRVDLEPEAVARSIETAGFGFMFAQRYHPAMRHVAPVRREIAVRTVFNLLGPLTNPARPVAQVIGVPSPAVAEKIAAALRLLGVQRGMVVAGPDGLDEIGLHGPTEAFLLGPEGIERRTIEPAMVGLSEAPLAAVAGGTPQENAEMIRDIFAGMGGPRRDIVLLNAGAALFVGGLAPTWEEGVAYAAEVVRAGRAREALERAVAVSQAA
ncbi:MAG: anthranilate phosphoribosyltransferase [Chloroflexota bacterium]|nr:anthranilate phosphoribosyltransferase [Dehalococcoidia bacterium]MDW8254397.1 anthranilate phosphoribosyltransferase [Chloroflexota bacterium]